jgi:hypothetical protein
VEFLPNVLIIIISDMYSLYVWFAMSIIELASDTTWTKLRYNSYCNFVVQVGGVGANVTLLNVLSAPIVVLVCCGLSSIGLLLNIIVMITTFRKNVRKQNLELATMR